jgi:hypothetical protein
MDFSIRIPNLAALVSRFQEAPSIAAPILQRALSASQAVLAMNTTQATVPWRTGFLVQTFQAVLQVGQLRWYPTASYARFVEFGTAPHTILPKNGKALYWAGADHPVRVVHHPGTKENPFMERIVAASQEGIEAIFETALEQVVEEIAAQ